MHNCADVIGPCLSALEHSDHDCFEVIAVDDASTDRTVEEASRHRCRVVRMEQNRGSSGARNRGVCEARGDTFVFVDSDVVVGSDTLRRLEWAIERNASDAVVGIYTPQHVHPERASRYKNLWIRWSYLQCAHERINWFFTACAAISRTAFLAVGGFDERLRSEGALDDIEFGHRLAAQGGEIFLDKNLQVSHLKRFRIRSLLRNDFRRASSWAGYAVRHRGLGRVLREGHFANVDWSEIGGIAIVFKTLAATALIPLLGSWAAGAALFGVLAYGWITLPMLVYFGAHHGLGFALASLPISLLDRLASGAGAAWGLSRESARRLLTGRAADRRMDLSQLRERDFAAPGTWLPNAAARSLQTAQLPDSR
jgi:GT2 family glycosyltransferase